MQFRFLHQSSEDRRNLILNGPITPTLLMLTVPTLMMGLVQSAIPFVDGLFINNFGGTIAASAINYCIPVVNMSAALAQGLSVASMAIIGQTNGRGEFKEARRISTQIFIFAFLLGFVVAPLLILAAYPVSNHVTPEISHNVFIYLALNSIVIPFSFLESIYNGIKNASGKPEAAFVRMLLMLVLKVIFNTIFVGILSWSVVGAVASTFLSNVLISLWMYYELFVKKSPEKFELKGFRFDFAVIRELFRLGIPSAISALILNLGFFLINNEIEKYGPVVMNAQGIASNITSVCFNLPSSFSSSVTTMVSMNVGAGQGNKARASCIRGSIISAITAAVLVAVIVPLSSSITVLFTRDTAVLSIADKALHIYTYSVIGFGVGMVEQGAFVGLGRTRVTLVMSLLRIWLLRYIFILVTERMLGFYSVFWGNLFSNYAAALIFTIMILRVKWVSVLSHRDMETAA